MTLTPPEAQSETSPPANGAANGVANGAANGVANGAANGVANGAANGVASNRIEPRQTRQRDAIARLIEGSDGPLSVPEIHDRARKTLPGIGIATIYRTLKLLHELKQVQPVILPSGETRYERTGIGHHEHFQCRGCSQVFDLDVCPVHIPRGTRLPGGFLVEDHVMTIYGLCSACQPNS